MKKFINGLKGKKVLAVFAVALMVSMIALPAFAEPVVEDPALELDFDMAQLFVWAQMVINVLLPIVYITLGISLGFLVIRALKSAFS